jgi:hypothetical protein
MERIVGMSENQDMGILMFHTPPLLPFVSNLHNEKRNEADRAHRETANCVTPKDLLRWRRGWDEPNPTRRCHTTTRLRRRRHLHESTR